MKHLKRLFVILCCLCLVCGSLVLTGGFRLSEAPVTEDAPPASAQDASSGDDGFNSKLTAMLHQYDTHTDVKIDCEDETSRFALRRLLVVGFNGNTYGAADYAYDQENDFCVLQFNTVAETENAYRQLTADGIDADPDVYMEFAEAPELCSYEPTVGAALGIPTFVQNFEMTPEDVVVAVIDTGVMYDQPDMADRFVSHGKDFSSDEAADAYYDTSCDEDTQYYHATFIAGIIANNTAENVKILPYKVAPFGPNGPSASAVVAAVNDAVKEGVSVINMSMHTKININAINNAVKNATGKGVCVCASAGNSGTECDAYPACSPEAITVGAIDAEVNLEQMTYTYEPFDQMVVASYSNYGDVVDFSAPGRVRSVIPTKDGSKRAVKSGTSFSTPYIAALCAEIKSMNKNLPKKEVYNILKDFAMDKGEPGKDPYYGYGVPNLSDLTYTDAENTYEMHLPQGTLAIHQSADYTADTQPWRLFAGQLLTVTVDSSVDRIGDYLLYNVSNARITVRQELNSIGDYAFYNCQCLHSYTFTIDVEKVGYKAFGNIDGFTVVGYRNTPAESYALSEGITFESLGCRHNYIYEVVEPTVTEDGYTVYTCTVCGDSYLGPYIEPEVLASGVCGDGVMYTLFDNGKLVIDGSGAMYNFFETEAPWYAMREQVRVLDIKSGVSYVNAFAFYGCNGLVKIVCDAANPYLYTLNGLSLISKDERELLLTAAKNEYTIPEDVRKIKAQALICTGNIAVIPNSRFSVENSLLYDADGNIVAALPEYAQSALKLDSTLTIKENAFMLAKYPKSLDTSVLDLQFEPYAIGYYYDGTMKKTSLVLKGNSESTAYAYAEANGFAFEGNDVGRCGEKITWRYDAKTGALYLYGSGDMFDYFAIGDIPWRQYLSKMKTVTVADGITSVSMYAFYNATALKTLTVPLSLAAPQDDTTWYNCSNIATLTLTYGSGYMDDYVQDDGSELYRFTPWYLSRSSITRFQLDENVKYIGAQAFRACTAIKELTLKSIEEIGADAFLANPYLTKVTILSRDVKIAGHALFYYFLSTYRQYKNPVLYAYADSGAHDYANQFLSDTQFVSLGCRHSCRLTVLHQEKDAYGRVSGTYRCEDCGEEFSEMAKHTVSLYVTTPDGVPVENAEIKVGRRENLVTDADGAVLFGMPKRGVYRVTVTCDGATLLEDEMYIDSECVEAFAVVPYGDNTPDAGGSLTVLNYNRVAA